MVNKRIISLLLAGMMLVASVGLAVAEEHITGMVVEKGDVIVLDAADGSYILEGSDMMADMVGKKVNVTGTIAEEGNARVITVIQIEEATE